MNVITLEVIDELSRIIEAVASDAAIKGCVVTSGKEAFSGGADLTMLQGLGALYEKLRREKGEEEAMRVFFEELRKLSLLYRRLETCGKPFAAAIHGVCLGGAFELALACHYRVVSDVDATRVGLPEIKVGLFPGAGGTQRVARLMQTGDALQMLFKGEQIRPLMAQQHGPRARGRAARPDRREGEGLDHAAAARPSRPGTSRSSSCPPARSTRPPACMIWPPANAIYRRETHDNYPAAQGDPAGGLRGPAAADGPRAQGRVALLRQDPALEGGGGDDPHAVRLDGRAQQGRAPARRRAGHEHQEGRRASAPASWARASPT